MTGYRNNGIRYRELCKTELPQGAALDQVIDVLTDVSKKKREILVDNNRIIEEQLTHYKKHPEEVDADAAQKIASFAEEVRGDVPGTIGDISIYKNACEVLLDYYERIQDYNKMALEAYFVMYCSNVQADFAKKFGEPEVYKYIKILQEKYDEMSEHGKKRFAMFLFAGVYNTGDLKNAPLRLDNACEFCVSHGMNFVDGDPDVHAAYVYATLDTAWQICEYYGMEKPIYTEQETGMMRKVLEANREILKNNDAGAMTLRCDLVLHELEFVLGDISADELIQYMRREFTSDGDEDSRFEVPTRRYFLPAEMLDVIWKYTDYHKNRKIIMTEEIVNAVLKNMRAGYGDSLVFTVTTDSAQFVMTAARYLGFDRMKDYVLKMTIYADKALYIHTAMVKEISKVILKEIFDSEPWYLNGVAGWDEEYIKYNPGEVTYLMEQCALFHDIGKYFCLDYVSNSSRNLTDDEFNVIKCHPVNFDEFFPKEKNEWFKCIRDSARLHHTWYDGTGGYPDIRGEKEALESPNRAFVNIISIADSIDAATDIIGRPYTSGKTFEMLLDEFDEFRDTRYSAFIIDICKHPRVASKISDLITNGRKKINYEIMLEK